MERTMFEETRFWFGYFVGFVLVTFFVAGLLQVGEWLTKIFHEPVNPIYLAAGGICGFWACWQVHEKK